MKLEFVTDDYQSIKQNYDAGSIVNVDGKEYVVVSWNYLDKKFVVNLKEKPFELPDEFYFKIYPPTAIFKAELKDDYYQVSWIDKNGNVRNKNYTVKIVRGYVEEQDWKIVDVPPESEEEKQFKQSIKLVEQDIEHYKRMIDIANDKIERMNKQLKELEQKRCIQRIEDWKH